MRDSVAASGATSWHWPAEWSAHEATWIAWPSHQELWGSELDAIRRSSAQLCRAIASGERVELLCRTQADELDARARLEGAQVRFHRLNYGDIWLRDTGPIFVVSDTGIAALDFGFDGWGGKYFYPDDALVAEKIARAAGIERIRSPLVLEGGAIDTDGQGTLLATRQCLLDGVRNVGASDAGYASELARTLGAKTLVWLAEGLQNDHTDGHVDTLARFVAPGVVACMEPRQGDPNRDVLRRIIDELSACRDARGQRLELQLLPSPGAILDRDGELLPASYVNFYIANRVVVVPIYGAVADDDAVARIAELFPTRDVVAIDARATLGGGGAFHCITQQQPRCPAL